MKERHLLGRTRRRWEDDDKMDLMEVGCDDRIRMNLTEDVTSGGLM